MQDIEIQQGRRAATQPDPSNRREIMTANQTRRIKRKQEPQ